MTKSNASLSVSEAMKPYYNQITSIIEPFCQKSLNEEYSQLSFIGIAAFFRKGPSPIDSGNANILANGIYAIGYVNFLFDKYIKPFSIPEKLATAFGIRRVLPEVL
ncbi:MAG: hypothetical protein H0U75_04110 [Legionella sp.]|nr:hypothetical protein [Legionella sp.]